MLLKYAASLMSGLLLCLLITGAQAQTATDDRQAIVDRQAVIADQQELNDAYHQLQQDQLSGNAAGVEIDQDNIKTAEQNFRTDEQRTIADDQVILAADQQSLSGLSRQLQQDQTGNTGAVAADESALKTLQQKFQTDKQSMVADDGLEVTRDQQALDDENQQLQQDMQDIDGEAADADKENIKEKTQILQAAQMKLQVDSNIH